MFAQFSKISLGVSTFSPVFPLFPISGFVAWEVTFSRKQTKLVHPDLVFNKMPVHQTHCQKHLGVYLDMKLNFKLHIKEKISKAMEEICIIKKLSNVLTRKSLITT